MKITRLVIEYYDHGNRFSLRWGDLTREEARKCVHEFYSNIMDDILKLDDFTETEAVFSLSNGHSISMAGDKIRQLENVEAIFKDWIGQNAKTTNKTL